VAAASAHRAPQNSAKTSHKNAKFVHPPDDRRNEYSDWSVAAAPEPGLPIDNAAATLESFAQ